MKDGTFYIPQLIDGKTGEVVREIRPMEDIYWSLSDIAVSDDGRFASILAELNSQNGAKKKVIVYDLQTGARYEVSDVFSNDEYVYYGLSFTPENDVVIACSGDADYVKDADWNGSFIALYDHSDGWKERYRTQVDYGKVLLSSYGLVNYSACYVDYLECGESTIAVACRGRLIMLEQETGEIRWQNDLPDHIVAGKMFPGDTIIIMVANGLITLCMSEDGMMTVSSMLGSIECKFSFAYGAICPKGGKPRTARYIAVSKSTPSQATVIGLYDNPRHTPFPGLEDEAKKSRVIVSPDQTSMVFVDSDSGDYPLTVTWYQPEGSLLKTIRSENEKIAYQAYMNAFGDIQLTNDGKLLMGARCIDLETEEFGYLTVSGEEPHGNVPSRTCVDPETGTVWSATLEKAEEDKNWLVLWKDGQLWKKTDYPFRMETDTLLFRNTLCAISSSGYIITRTREDYDADWKYILYSAEKDTYTACPWLGSSDQFAFALADQHPWVAFQKESGEVLILDIPSGEERIVLAEDIMAETVRKLLFYQEDEQLFVFTSEGEMRIYQTSDGKFLFNGNYLSNNLRYGEEDRYEIKLHEQTNKLLIFYDSVSYREPSMTVLDLKSYQEAGNYLNVSAWLSETDELLLVPYSQSPYLSPFFTLEELEEQAEEILATGLPY